MLHCPKCKEKKGNVMDSRADPDGTRWRRYLCGKCAHKWFTKEVSIEATPAKELTAIRKEIQHAVVRIKHLESEVGTLADNIGALAERLDAATAGEHHEVRSHA